MRSKLLVVWIVSACGSRPAPPAASPRAPAAAPHASQDTSKLTAETVLARIQTGYIAAIKRCYKDYLKKDATAQGKVVLAFTVDPTGRSAQAAAHGFNDEVDACITAEMASWQFPVPTDDQGAATSAQFSITLRLVPD